MAVVRFPGWALQAFVWLWPEALARTLVSAGTHELASRIDLKECTSYVEKPYNPGQRAVRKVAKAFRLRSELIEVHILNESAEIKKPLGAVS